jgi:hypothetical protein
VNEEARPTGVLLGQTKKNTMEDCILMSEFFFVGGECSRGDCMFKCLCNAELKKGYWILLGLDRSVVIATGYRLDGPGIESSPPNLLYNGYRVFPWLHVVLVRYSAWILARGIFKP